MEVYNAKGTTEDNIPIGTRVYAVEFPDNNIILIVANEATIMGKYDNNICYEKQMEENGILVHKTEDGQTYIEAYGFIIPLNIKETMQTMKIRRPTEQELRTCDQVHLTNELQWNTESVNKQELTHDEYNSLVSQAKDFEVCSTNLKKQIRRMRDARMINWYKFNNYFLYPCKDMIKDTIQKNKMSGNISHAIPTRKHQKTRNTLLTCNRLSKGYDTKTVFSNVTSFEGYNCA